MAKLTKAEAAWIKKLQKVLNECPSDRMGFYTTGESDVFLFDRTFIDDIDDHLNNDRCGDFCKSVDAFDAEFEEHLTFPSPVESTSG